MQKYSVNQSLVETLLAWVRSGEVAIPEIQRPFVWDASQVRDLLDSLYKGFPVGYIIVWKNPDVRLKDGSLSVGAKVLIDGQQRITALRAALLGERVLNRQYKQVPITIAFNPQSEEFKVKDATTEKMPEWLPDIGPLIGGNQSLLALHREYLERNPNADPSQIEATLTKLRDIVKTQVGIIELAADLDIETVTEIFIRINRKGVPLSQADFAMSKIASQEAYDGHSLRKAIDYFCHMAVAPEFCRHIEDNDQDFASTEYFKAMRWLRHENDDLYDPDYSDLLRVAFVSKFKRGKFSDLVALLSGRDFEKRTYVGEIAEKSFATLSDGVKDFINETNFKRYLMILQSAGFIDASLITAKLPVNFGYALFLALRAEKVGSAQIEKLVRKWFVLSLLTSRYSGPTETRFEQDIREVSRFDDYLASIEAAELSDAFWEIGLVQDLTTSNIKHPAFRTFLASQVKANDKGFLSADIDVRSLIERRGDVHHLFPKDGLKKQLGLTRSRYNQVANYVLMEQPLNIKVGNDEPKEYMGKVLAQISDQEAGIGNIVDPGVLDENLSQHAIPSSIMTAHWGDYENFLEERRKLMARKIQHFYQQL